MNAPPIRITSTGEVVAWLPHFLGFHPAGSLVCVSLASEPRLVRFAMRIDLPEPADRDTIAGEVAELLASHDTAGVILVTYERDDIGASVEFLAAAAAACESAGITVMDAASAHEGRVMILGEHEGAQEVPKAPEAVAERVAAGKGPLESLEALAALFEPGADAERAEKVAGHYAQVVGEDGVPSMGALIAGASTWATIMDGEGEDSHDGRQIPAARLAAAVALVQSRTLRDVVMLAMCPQLPRVSWPQEVAEVVEILAPFLPSGAWRESATSSAVAVSRLRRTIRAVPRDLSVPVLALAGMVEWYAGNGAAARCAVEAALEIDPSYTLAMLLHRGVTAGIRPPSIAHHAEQEVKS